MKIMTIEEMLKEIEYHIKNLAKEGWDRLYFERDRNIVVTFKSKEEEN